jgi:hypothetical protein
MVSVRLPNEKQHDVLVSDYAYLRQKFCHADTWQCQNHSASRYMQQSSTEF